MGSFDNIAQDFILKAIGPFPARELIRQWLKAGYVEQGVWHATESGTGQGAVVSPLLANIALHGLESALGIVRNARGHIKGPRTVIRYADDFVVLCETKDDATDVIALLTDWLAERGLTLSEDKTRIVHLTDSPRGSTSWGSPSGATQRPGRARGPSSDHAERGRG